MGTDNITESAAHSGMYEKYRARYGRGGCTKGQLSRLVALGALTPEEYEEITGEAYGA